MPDFFDTTATDLGLDPSWAQGGFTGGVATGSPVAKTTGPDPALVNQFTNNTQPIYQPWANPTNNSGIAQQELNAYMQANSPAPALSGRALQDKWIQFTNQLAGYTGEGGAFDASAGRSGASQAATQARNNLQPLIDRFNAENGTNAKVVGGDKVDFGDGSGVTDVIRDVGNGVSAFTAGGGGGGGAGAGGFGDAPTFNARGSYTGGGAGGGGSLGSMGMPTAPTTTQLGTPDPFTYQPSTLGNFNGPAPYQAPSPFSAPSQTPTPQQIGYTPFSAPGNLTAQQVGTPAQLNYNPAATPTAFAGSRQATPGTLSYQNLATPENFQYQTYAGPTAAELQADPSYQFRLKQGQDVLEGSAASKGTLRTGNTAKALIDYGQGAASQEYGNVFARGLATSQANNAGRLGAYQSNAQTGLAYNQNQNQNALNFGQANIANAANANEANYGRSASEAQQGFSNAFNVNQANNAGNFQTGQANIGNQLNAAQANNAANLGFGQQNFQQGFSTNQANNQGAAAATQANNAANLAAQGQGFNQALGAYGLNASTQQGAQAQNYGQALAGYQANQAAQQQGYGQALGAYTTNTGNQLAFGQANNQANLANYQAQTNAALGLGNLNLGYTQAGNSYNLGLGNLGVSQGQLGLAQQGQQYNQGLNTYLTNYQTQVADPWNRNYQLAGLGNPGAPNTGAYGAQGADLYAQQGNANAAAQLASGGAWANALGGLANAGAQYGLFYGGNGQPQQQLPGYYPRPVM